MVLPVLGVYGTDYAGATPFLIGLALGCYGFAQACLQIPLGFLSDIVGRKRVIFIGLVVFALGSVIAAFSDSIYGVILGRVLQGAGAIAGVLMAMVGDLIEEEFRSRAMAIIGASIGASFVLAMVIGPFTAGMIGVSGVFALTAILASIGIGVLVFGIPNPPASLKRQSFVSFKSQIVQTLQHPQLMRLDVSVFALHAILMAMFVVVPSQLNQLDVVTLKNQWMVYAPVVMLSFAFVMPFLRLGEKKRKVKTYFLAAVGMLICSLVLMIFFHELAFVFILALFLFFIGFNYCEATLPSWASKLTSARTRGTAMGVFSSSQFLGAFMGGVSGGFILGAYGSAMVYLFCVLLSVVWLLSVLNITAPKYIRTLSLDVDARSLQMNTVFDFAGVEEASHQPATGTLVLRVDRAIFDENAFRQFLAKG